MKEEHGFCGYCGEPVTGDDLFCGACGRPVDDGADPAGECQGAQYDEPPITAGTVSMLQQEVGTDVIPFAVFQGSFGVPEDVNIVVTGKSIIITRMDEEMEEAMNDEKEKLCKAFLASESDDCRKFIDSCDFTNLPCQVYVGMPADAILARHRKNVAIPVEEVSNPAFRIDDDPSLDDAVIGYGCKDRMTFEAGKRKYSFNLPLANGHMARRILERLIGDSCQY